jgi:hypothetical protein
MVHFVAGGEPADLLSALSAAAAATDEPVLVLERMADGLASPNAPYACGVETAAQSAAELAAIVAAVESHIDPSSSVALAGVDFNFVECPPAPIRYQYLMRRRQDYSHADYLERYGDIHSQFGIATPGIEGYTQFHVDLEASAALAKELGLGVADVDSVSELHLASMEKFFGAIADSDIGDAASADEELFVARADSAMYTSVVHRFD